MASANYRSPSKQGQNSSFVKPLSFEQVSNNFWKRNECSCPGNCEVCGLPPAAEREMATPARPKKECREDLDIWPFDTNSDQLSEEPSVSLERGQEDTNKNEASGTTIDDPVLPLNNFDPQASQFNSILNLDTEDIHQEDEAVIKLLGKKLPDFNECPFDDGVGGCFKARCFKTHRPPSDKGAVVEATGQRGFHFDDLPRKHHPKSAEVVFLGHITYARSPDEFYILPEWNFDCDCELERNFDPRYSNHKFVGTGKYGRQEVTYLLEEYMKKRGQEVVQTMVYLFGELVICSKTPYGICRGAVLKNVAIDDDGPESVPVFLIDIGETIHVPFKSVYTAPSDLTKTQPLVYKCSLFGVTPVGLQYSSRARDFFYRLVVKDKHQVRIHVVGKGSRRLSMFCEKRPYMVNLCVTYKQKSIRVAQILQDFGLAVQLNLTPFRPLAFKDLGDDMLSMTEFVLGEAKTPSAEELKEICEKEVADWEKWEAGCGWKSKLSKEEIDRLTQRDEHIHEMQMNKSLVPSELAVNFVRALQGQYMISKEEYEID